MNPSAPDVESALKRLIPPRVARDPAAQSRPKRRSRLARIQLDMPGEPVKARPAQMRGDMPVKEAFKSVMQAGLVHLLENERGMLADADPEYLHQMRVALRRLRSAVGGFTPPLPATAAAPLDGELKWLAGSLGPARDWDVFMTETLPPIAAEFGSHAELEAFSSRCENLRRAAGSRARRAVRSLRYRRLTLSAAAWLTSESWLARIGTDGRLAFEAPVTEFATAVLERRHAQVRKRGRGLAGLTPAQLHRLRIAIKKFRYAADFFSGLYEHKAVTQALKRLARLQNILGAMNDAVTVANLMARGFEGTAGRQALEAKGILLGWSRGRAATLKRELRGAWKEFRAAEKFW